MQRWFPVCMHSTHIRWKKILHMRSSYFLPANESYMKWHDNPEPSGLLLFGRLGLGDKILSIKKEKKRALETEGSTTVFFYDISLIITRVNSFITFKCSLQLNATYFNFWCEKFKVDKLCSVQMQVSKWFSL